MCIIIFTEEMESLGTKISLEYKPKRNLFRSRRDELVSLMTEGINFYRVATKWKPIAKRTVALLINKNPFLAHSDDEIELLYNECLNQGSFAKFFWVTMPKTCKEDDFGI